MLSNTLLSLAVLVAPALANYGNDQCKAGHNAAGACLVAANTCKQECSSFMRATVTPCPSTRTKTVVTIVTNPPSTATITTSITDTNTVTNTVTSVITDVIDETDTVYQPVTVVLTDDVPATEIVTLTTTVPVVTVTSMTTLAPVVITVTTTTITTFPEMRRRAKRTASSLPSLPPPLTADNDVHARSAKASACTPKTVHPTHVPWKANACHNAAQYSSACSCAGVKAHTETLPAQITTVTTTSTVNVFPTVTATATATLFNTATATLVSLVTSLTSTIDATTTILQTTQDTLTITVTNTIITTDIITPTPVTTIETDVPSPVTTDVAATCSSVNLVAVGGTYNGQFVNAQDPNANNGVYGYVTFTSSVEDGNTLDLAPNGEVLLDNTYQFVSQPNTYPYYILTMTEAERESYGLPDVICSVSTGVSLSIAGSIGEFTCTFNGGAVNFYSCSEFGNFLAQGTNDALGTCTQLQLAAIPACQGV